MQKVHSNSYYKSELYEKKYSEGLNIWDQMQKCFYLAKAFFFLNVSNKIIINIVKIVLTFINYFTNYIISMTV